MNFDSIKLRIKYHLKNRSLIATLKKILEGYLLSFWLSYFAKENSLERSASSFLGKRMNAKEHLGLAKFLEEWYGKSRADTRIDIIPSTCFNNAPKIFMFWDDGFKTAPPIVRLCARQALCLHREEDVIFLDERNLQDYIELPESVAGGQVDRVKRSNFIRLELLCRYGGIWLDATCFPTEDILLKYQQLTNEGSKCFWFCGESPGEIQTFTIIARQGSRVLHLMRAAWLAVLLDYPGKKPYFWFQMSFKSLYHLDEEFRREYDAMRKISYHVPHLLPRKLFSAEPQDDVPDCLKTSFVHKMTHKAPKNKQEEVAKILCQFRNS